MDTQYTSTTTHVGGMRCQSRFAPSGAEFATDVAASLGGKGEYPSPGDMLACTVASCMLSNIAYTGRQKDFLTEGISIEARYEATDKGISALCFDIRVPVSTSSAARRMMEPPSTPAPWAEPLRRRWKNASAGAGVTEPPCHHLRTTHQQPTHPTPI